MWTRHHLKTPRLKIANKSKSINARQNNKQVKIVFIKTYKMDLGTSVGVVQRNGFAQLWTINNVS